jgi:hypothetical protein
VFSRDALQGRTPHGAELPRHRDGDAINAVLAAAGYNFRRLIAWLGLALRLFL